MAKKGKIAKFNGNELGSNKGGRPPAKGGRIAAFLNREGDITSARQCAGLISAGLYDVGTSEISPDIKMSKMCTGINTLLRLNDQQRKQGNDKPLYLA